LLQALAKDPEQRFSRVEALVNAFCGDADTVSDRPAPAAPIVAANLGRTSELFVRIGVRGKRGMIIGGVAVVALLTAVVLGTRHPAPATDGSAAAIPTSSDYGGTWRLAHTDCLPGAMPRQVTVTQSGGSFS